MSEQAKIDLYKENKVEYGAGKKPRLIEAARAQYLTVSGTGAPGGETFQEAIGALYGMAFTIKMTRKFAGKGDYVVSKLECVYSPGKDADFTKTPMAEWNWTLMIRTPDAVGQADLDDAADKLLAKGKAPGADQVTLTEMSEGQCVQMLHVGPYEDEADTIAVMKEFATAQGLRMTGRHHEVYLSDPRRVPPERLRTIVRMPVG